MAAVTSQIPAQDRWQFEELLQCMICFESYRSPKMLKCGHTFCAECLIGYLKTYALQKRAEPGKLPCPTCRELTTLPATGVVGLRNDFKIRQIEDLFRTMNIRQKPGHPPAVGLIKPGGNGAVPDHSKSAVSKQSDQNCAVCQLQKKISKARARCTDCERYYCDSCLRRHSSNALFKSHSVVIVNIDPTALNGSSPAGRGGFMISDLQCKRHPAEQGKYLCRTCESVICTVCVVHEHSDHDAAEVAAVVREQQQDVLNLRSMMQHKHDALKRRSSELELLRQANIASCASSEQSIRNKVKQTMDALRKKETSMIEDLQRMRTAKVNAIDLELGRVRDHIARTQTMGQLAQVTARSNAVRLVGVHEDLIQRLRTIVEADTLLGDEEGQAGVVTFLPTRGEPDIGRIEEMNGSIEDAMRLVTPPTSPGDSQPDLGRPRPPTNHNGAPVPQQRVSLAVGVSRIRPKLLYQVTAVGAGQGEIRDPLCVGCLLNGEIVVTEWTNKRLQIFDPATNRSVRVIAGGLVGPQGLAITLKGNIIITDVTQKRLQVFSPTGASLSKWGLGQFHSPCGVTVSANGNCIVTDTVDHSVHIFQGEKSCLRRFGSKGAGDEQFDNPLYVTTGKHNEIIVSDSNNHCLKVFNSTGQFVRRIGSEGDAGGQFKFPRGVCINSEGHIIVADRNNDRISLFSLHGRFIRHLLTKEDGIKSPYGVAMSVAGHLVISENSTSKAAIKMFQL